eukprot:scaffold180956_cov18-Tisochrysis_lutea.AAC.1
MSPEEILSNWGEILPKYMQHWGLERAKVGAKLGGIEEVFLRGVANLPQFFQIRALCYEWLVLASYPSIFFKHEGTALFNDEAPG